jgi:hypothetical protein
LLLSYFPCRVSSYRLVQGHLNIDKKIQFPHLLACQILTDLVYRHLPQRQSFTTTKLTQVQAAILHLDKPNK